MTYILWDAKSMRFQNKYKFCVLVQSSLYKYHDIAEKLLFWLKLYLVTHLIKITIIWLKKCPQ